MNPRTLLLSSKSRRSHGFTLIELLIVITIIAVLATLIFAGGTFALKKAKRVDAQNTAVALSNAISEFESEYHRFPIPSGSGKGQDWIGDSSEELVKILAGKETGSKILNKKKINFLGGLRLASGTPPVGGIDLMTNEESPIVYDPWGNFYVVHIDGNYDEEVENPEAGESTEDDKIIRGLRIAVLSKGEDGVASGTNDSGENAKTDNAKSW